MPGHPPSVVFEIKSRTPFADGVTFGTTGAYEVIVGSATAAIDPLSRSFAVMQRQVVDIDLARRDADGMIRFRTDVWLLKPVDVTRGNDTLLFEFVNRGNKRCLQFFNDGNATNQPISLGDAGNGFLMQQGYTVLACAWQADVLRGDGRITMDVPQLQATSEQTLSARVRSEFIVDRPGTICLPLSGKNGTRSSPALADDNRSAELRRRRYPFSEAEPIGNDAWEFARVDGKQSAPGAGDVGSGEQAIVPSRSHIHLPAGFEPGWIYELLYDASEPIAADLGFVAVRELIGFLRYRQDDSNPLYASGKLPEYVIGWGRSQSGRAIRDFLHRGFNEYQPLMANPEQHAIENLAPKRVFDGMLPHVSGGGKTVFHRFVNLVIPASRQYEDNLHPADRFPFSYAWSQDHITGVSDAILKRPETDPFIIHTHTGSEYWYRRGSLVHTDTQGNDLAQPANVRIYHWSSSQHWSDPKPAHPANGICENYQNIVATVAFFRGTLQMMRHWIVDGTTPPPSRIPMRADNTLVPFDQWQQHFPSIPGTALPASPNVLPYVDYGPDFASGAPIVEPPKVSTSQYYTVLVPATDEDGNDIAGLRAPMVSAPLGTYTGWNLRARGYGAGALHDFSGSYIPFPETQHEATLTRDPRRAIKVRYATADDYTVAIRHAAQKLYEEKFLIEADVARTVERARHYGSVNHIHTLTDA